MDKQFETLLLKKHINSKLIQEANVIVEQFIHNHELIIYGGTAIDFACRLRGEKIYPDDILPFTDYDFFSPRSVQDAYKLALILYQAQFPDVTAFMAQHGRTMRVAMGGHIVADISWLPEKFFRKIPTKEFPASSDPTMKLKFTSPEYQITDMHLSLSFPFSNPPLEVVNGRALKDVKRYKILFDLWIKDLPRELELDKLNLREYSYNLEARCPKDPVWTGFASLALHQQRHKADNPIFFDGKTIKVKSEFDVPIEYITEGLEPTHNRLLDYYPESNRGDTIAYLPKSTLFPILTTNGHKHCTLQYVLTHLALRASTKNSRVYWKYYFDALKLLDPKEAFGDAIWPSIDHANLNDTSEIWRDLTLANIADIKSSIRPNSEGSATQKVQSIRPKKMIPEMTPEDRIPEFMAWDYPGPIFKADGQKIK